MKLNLFLLVLCFSLNSFSAEVLHHKVSRGKHHKGGEIKLFIKEQSADSFIATIDYKVKKKFYVPVSAKHLSGHLDQALPMIFSTKEGYLQLQEMKEIKIDEATLKFIGRESIGRYYDTYKIQILPDNKKWRGMLWYHPSVASVGWLKTELTLLTIPIIGPYKVQSTIK